MKIDIELIETKIKELLQTGFAAKVAEINSEKGDDLLENVDNEFWYNDLYTAEILENIFIHYGLENISVESIGYNNAEEWKVFYKIYIEKQNNLEVVRSAVLRYSRVFKEILQESIDEISQLGAGIAEMTVTEPQDLVDINNQTAFKQGGIEFKIKFA